MSKSKKREGGLKKPVKVTRVRSNWASGDDTMEKADEWVRDGSGVSDQVKDVDEMPNESVMRDEQNEHLR